MIKNMGKRLTAIALSAMFILGGCGSEKSKQSPYEIKVGGKTYEINEKEGIVGYGDMPNLAYMVKRGEMQGVKKGLPDGNAIDVKDVSSIINLRGTVISQIDGIMEANNGYNMGARDFSETYERFDEKTDISGYCFSFVNDFCYMGITADSSAKDIEAAGFQHDEKNKVYYNIYSSAGMDWSKIDKEFKELEDNKVSHAMMVTNPKDQFASGIDYIAAFSTCSGSWKNFDLGFGEFIGVRTREMVRMYYALGTQLYELNNHNTDFVVMVQIISADEADKDTLQVNGSNECYVSVFTSKKNITNWPAKWGFEGTAE